MKNRIRSKGKTALGGDNRTGCAVLVTLAETLLKGKLPHPPLTLLFTVREESGLFGARYVDPKELGSPVMGFNFDGRDPAGMTIGAVGAERWEVAIHGKASHAGVYPEKGISATLVAALALAEAHRGGWFGKIRKKEGEGTSNVGSVAGRDGKSAGEATNVVTDYVHIRGEAAATMSCSSGRSSGLTRKHLLKRPQRSRMIAAVMPGRSFRRGSIITRSASRRMPQW